MGRGIISLGRASSGQSKGRFLPSTSLLKVPSSFLAAKVVVCVLARRSCAPESIQPELFGCITRMYSQIGIGHRWCFAFSTPRGTWTENEVSFFTRRSADTDHTAWYMVPVGCFDKYARTESPCKKVDYGRASKMH